MYINVFMYMHVYTLIIFYHIIEAIYMQVVYITVKQEGEMKKKICSVVDLWTMFVMAFYRFSIQCLYWHFEVWSVLAVYWFSVQTLQWLSKVIMYRLFYGWSMQDLYSKHWGQSWQPWLRNSVQEWYRNDTGHLNDGTSLMSHNENIRNPVLACLQGYIFTDFLYFNFTSNAHFLSNY